VGEFLKIYQVNKQAKVNIYINNFLGYGTPLLFPNLMSKWEYIKRKRERERERERKRKEKEKTSKSSSSNSDLS